MTELNTLIQQVCAERTKRGFVTDPVKLTVLLTEEVGEIAQLMKRSWSANYPDPDTNEVAEELADAFCLLAALANEYGIDLEAAIQAKFFDKDAGRDWATAE